ncbi:hypothetical protein BGX30_013138 [Mortierella sp. GBA39]|nr:hypothetical protein BGX30_013138 [Mortierella sp. GBA39]
MTSPTSSPHQPQPAPTSPIEIPELLEKIHAFIPLRALRHSVIYVCRQWFLINRHHITPRELVWEYHYQNESMDKAGVLGRIKLYFRSRDQEQGQDTKVVGRSLLYEPTPILDFNLSGTYPSTKVYELIPYLSHVTVLRIDQNSDHHIYPYKIFQGCPHLLRLYVGSKTRVEMFDDWLPSAPEEQQPFTLRELILHNAYLKQDILEEFLGFTPYLTDLHLSNLSIKGRPVIFPDQRYDCRALIAVIKSLGLPLKTFHFSVYMRHQESWDALVDEDLFKSICQDSREWTFAMGDLTPQLFQNIQCLPNTLTTLNMVNRHTAFYTPDSKLHLFLCTSPQLLHLRIPRTTYHMSYLDLYHRIPSVVFGDRSTTAQETEAARYPDPGVWACRGLRTLHIAFEKKGGRRTKTRLEYSRVAFGYIVKVCPALIELEIHAPNNWERYAFQQYDLAGGFCLLAGLRDLERLRVPEGPQTNVAKLHDMDWITSPRNLSSSTGQQNREERRKIVSQWKGLLLAEAQKDSKRLKMLGDEFQKHEGLMVPRQRQRQRQGQIRKEEDEEEEEGSHLNVGHICRGLILDRIVRLGYGL